MPVSFSSAARNLFLLGSSGADSVTNFFKAIDLSSGTDDGYVTTGIGVGDVIVSYLGQTNYKEYHFSGTKTDPNSKVIGWVDKRQENATLDWNAEINETTGNDVFLTDLYLDKNHTGLDGDNEVIVCGSSGQIPFVSKYDKDGVVIWSATSQTGDVKYNSVTTSSMEAGLYSGSSYEGFVYACGNTSESGEAYAVVEKFNGNSGAPDWGKRFTIEGSDVVLTSIDTQPRGTYVIAVGYLEDINSEFKGYFTKIDSSTGDIIWDRTLEITDRDWGTVPVVKINDVKIDGNGFIYLVGSQFNAVSGMSAGFICKYTEEGNMLWQKETSIGAANFGRWRYNCVEADTQTGQIIILGSYFENTSDEYGILVKYSSDGTKLFSRIIESTETTPPEFGALNEIRGGMALDADASFYYVLFTDQETIPANNIPDKYTFGKVSSSGNGLGNFSYDTGDTNGVSPITIEYNIQNSSDRIGRLSDGSVRNDTSDLATNILNGTKIMFDDLATPITNKKRQMGRAGDFVVSGSPAIRPVDFQELNLLGNVYSGSGDWLDQSGKGNDGNTSTGEPFYDAGGVRFDGNDDLSIGSAGDFNFLHNGATDWTVEFWAKTGTATRQFVWGTGASSAQTGFHLQIMSASDAQSDATGVFALVGRGAAGNYIGWGADNCLTVNTWHHIAAVFKSSDKTLALYVDGIEVDNDAGTVNGTFAAGNYSSSDSSYPFTVGKNIHGNSNFMNGEISNLRVVAGSRIYTSNFTPPTETLTAISNTSLLTCQGNSIADASSSTHSITINGAVSDLDSERPTHNAAGYWDFDGVDDRITIPYTPKLAFTDAIISLEAWIYIDDLTDRFPIINKRDDNAIDSTNRPYVLGVNSSGRLKFSLDKVDGGPFTTICETATGAIVTGQWYHVAGIHDGTTSKIYINGSESASIASGTTSLENTGDVPTRIGHRNTSSGISYGDGRIGEVRIYPRGLTPAQVFQNYNATKTKYTNELPEVAPRIGSGIVYGSNLLLNYDFGNKACISKTTIRDRDITDTDVDDFLSRHELESTELVIFSPIGDKGDFFGRALDSADGIIATSDDAISDTFWFNGISFRSQTPGGEVYLYTFGDAVDNISADSSAYEAALIATIRPPATYWNRGVAEVQGALSVGDGVVVFSGFDHSKINVVENKSVAPLAYVVISDYRGNITNIIHDPNYTDSARQLTPVGYNTERLDLQQGVWVRDYVNNNRTSLWGNQTIVYDKKIYVSDVLGDKIYIYTLEGNLLTTVGIPVSEQGTTDFQGFPEEQMFGYSISINDGILAVGAPNDNNGDSANDGMGSVYLFDTSTLAYLRKIIPSSGIDRGAFGSVVKIGHNRIVVGQPQTQAPFSPTGNIWMFDYDGNFIDNLDTVNNVTNYLGSEQQSSFAITEKYVFVGYAKTGRGQVNVFDTVTGVHQGRMDPRSPLGETSGNYGRSMTIASNGYDQKIIIGNTKSEGKLYYHDLTKREIGTTVKNLSSSSYPGTLDGPTFNSVGYFETDGSSDNITIPGLSLSGTGGFTVELWMKFTGLQSNAGGWNYFLRDEDGLTPPQYEVGVYGNDNYSFIFKQNSISDSVSTVLTQNQWHHICFGVNTSQQLGFIYKDGVYAGGSTNSFSTGVIPLNKLFGNFATNTGLAGQFGEIRGYDDELSGAEVLQNFNATRGKYGV